MVFARSAVSLDGAQTDFTVSFGGGEPFDAVVRHETLHLAPHPVVSPHLTGTLCSDSNVEEAKIGEDGVGAGTSGPELDAATPRIG